MDLSPQTAESIVVGMKDIFNHEVNFFDASGTIIASTDHSRVGTGHDGARLVIKTKEPLLIRSDDEYKGAKRGINVPVLFNGAAIAVIGITGEPEEVMPFGSMLRKMTEILVRENWEQMARFDQRSTIDELIDLLVQRYHDESRVRYIAAVANIDLSLPHRFVVGRFRGESRVDSTDMSLYGALYADLRCLAHSYFSLTPLGIRILLDERDMPSLTQALKSVQAHALTHRGEPAYFGIGSLARESEWYWRSYHHAQKSLDWLIAQGDESATVTTYDDALRAGLTLVFIPRHEQRALIREVFGNADPTEIAAWHKLLRCYQKNNGSITKCAEELYLHKNTVQNRLNRIAKVTGYNPRELSDFTMLMNALMVWSYLQVQHADLSSACLPDARAEGASVRAAEQ